VKNIKELRAEFDRCWPWLWASLCRFGPTHSKEQVWWRIASEAAFLWSTEKCVVLGEFIDHPIGYRSFNYWLQGPDLLEVKKLHSEIEVWAAQYGCACIAGLGRDGWGRVMDGAWEMGPRTRVKWLKPEVRAALRKSAPDNAPGPAC
jgi:hypothetical protein